MEPATRIISASRRTDLPGYHAAACAARLRRLRKPVHSVFFWTRYPAALCDDGPLAELVRHAIENPFVLLTVTGLGGSELEPRVPTTAVALGRLEALIEALRGDPRRLIWRYDPVIKGRMSPERFEALAQVFGPLGVRTCIISFPARLSLKGPLDGQYARFGIQRWGRQEKLDGALRLAEAAARHGVTLQACVQPQLIEDARGAVQPGACISAELAVALHPRGLPLELPKDLHQRRHCRCAVSHDIGSYDDRCGSGCAYCYSSAGGPKEQTS